MEGGAWEVLDAEDDSPQLQALIDEIFDSFISALSDLASLLPSHFLELASAIEKYLKIREVFPLKPHEQEELNALSAELQQYAGGPKKFTATHALKSAEDRLPYIQQLQRAFESSDTFEPEDGSGIRGRAAGEITRIMVKAHRVLDLIDKNDSPEAARVQMEAAIRIFRTIETVRASLAENSGERLSYTRAAAGRHLNANIRAFLERCSVDAHPEAAKIGQQELNKLLAAEAEKKDKPKPPWP